MHANNLGVSDCRCRNKFEVVFARKFYVGSFHFEKTCFLINLCKAKLRFKRERQSTAWELCEHEREDQLRVNVDCVADARRGNDCLYVENLAFHQNLQTRDEWRDCWPILKRYGKVKDVRAGVSNVV